MGNRLVGFALALALVLPGTAGAHYSDSRLINETATGLAGLGRDFEFLDDTGRLRRLAELQGKVVAVFFGFTSCPDVCPDFLAKASLVTEMLDDDGAYFEVVFVTVDARRDTREVISDYLALFGGNMTGARIPQGQLTGLLADFGLTRQVVRDANGDVTISHSVGAFLFDANGTPQTYLPGGKLPAEIVEAVRRLLPPRAAGKS